MTIEEERKQKKRDYRRKNYLLNREKVSIQAKLWRQNNIEKVRRYCKKWHNNNKNYWEEYRKKNSDKLKKIDRIWRKENAERIKKLKRKYYLENKDTKIRDYTNQNKLKIKDKKKARYNMDKNTPSYKEKRKKYLEEHKGNYKKYSEDYRKNNRNALLKQKKEYYLINKEKILKNNRQYIIHKLHTDNTFKIMMNIRTRLRQAFKYYSKNGKTKTSDKYRINYSAIIEYLKPFPQKISQQHIDHIISLAAFNFDNLDEVYLACIPENHQWLPGLENLSKNDFLTLNGKIIRARTLRKMPLQDKIITFKKIALEGNHLQLYNKLSNWGARK